MGAGLRVTDGMVRTFQVLDNAPETVAVGSDQDPLALLDLRDDLLIPEGQGAGDRVLQAFARGQLVLG